MLLVVKKEQVQELIIEPVRSLKKVMLSLDSTNVSFVKPSCTVFTLMLGTGWISWLQSQYPRHQSSHAKCDVVNVLGGVGAGLGTLNSMNVEVLATKLVAVSTQMKDLAALLD